VKYKSVRGHLKPYGIHARRRTTVNHAFAAAIAPNDVFDEARIRGAVRALGQDPDEDLRCVYCDAPAQTWDHVFATVHKGEFSGHGHRLGNLLPCCKPCNSAKGSREWRKFLATKGTGVAQQRRIELIQAYLDQFQVVDPVQVETGDHREMARIKREVLELLQKADIVASRIRGRGKA
jgi:hypothetical protein